MTNRIFHSCFLIATLYLMVAYTPLFAQKRKPPVEAKSANARLSEAEFFFTEAEKFFILEDYAKALLYFERVAELNPESATVHYKIAEILAKGTQEEDLQKAARSIELAIKLDKSNKYFYLLASNIYAGLGEFEKATKSLETMMVQVKGTEEYLYELAALYLYNKQEDQALKIYNQAEELLGVNEVSSQQKQRIYIEKGKIQEAVAEGEKLWQAYPDEPAYLMNLAELLAQRGQRTKAITYMEEFIKEHPEAGSTKMLLAAFYKDNGQEQKSRDFVIQVFEDPAIDVSSKVMMMGTYTATISQNRTKNNTDAQLETFAMQLFEKLSNQYPNEANVHLVGGDLFMTLENDEQAKREYLQAVRAGSGSFEVWQNLLYLEIESGELDSLLVHSEQALELFPNQGMIYYFNGYGHLRKNHYKEAAYSLEQAKKLITANQPFIGELNAMLGDCYNGSKEYAKSDQAYDQALAINPNNDIVLNNYSYYLALRKENLEKAEKMSGQLVKAHPENSSYLDTHAWVLYAREKYKEARKVMEKAIQTGQATATHFEHYGDILFQLGDIDGAVAQWRKAKENNTDNARLDKKISNRKIN